MSKELADTAGGSNLEMSDLTEAGYDDGEPIMAGSCGSHNLVHSST